LGGAAIAPPPIEKPTAAGLVADVSSLAAQLNWLIANTTEVSTNCL